MMAGPELAEEVRGGGQGEGGAASGGLGDFSYILASASPTRQRLLEHAGWPPSEAVAPAVDEEAVLAGLDGVPPGEAAAELAWLKARSVEERLAAAGRGSALILAADQIAVRRGAPAFLGKPPRGDAAAVAMVAGHAGKRLELHTAAVLVQGGRRLWGAATLSWADFAPFTEAEAREVVRLQGPATWSVAGGCLLEGPAVRLLAGLGGDPFSLLGLPLLELAAYLRVRRMDAAVRGADGGTGGGGARG